MTMQKNIVGQQIRSIRKARLMSQEQLSEMIGIDPKSIGRIEKGDYHPALDTLMRFASALNVSVRDLFPEDNTNPVGDNVAIAEVRHALVDFVYSADESELIRVYKQITQIKNQ